MRLMTTVAMCLAVVAAGTAAHAQAPAVSGICVAIDEARDSLSPQERTAALLLLAREFEAAGWRVLPEGCASGYALSHARLGDTIAVSLSGPGGRREGTALGLDDLPALYSQMVRSLVTGRPMSGFNVVDRTNVTAYQNSARRVGSDSFFYARLGYGSVFGSRAYPGPALGFGWRTELDSFAVDVSFLNMQFRNGESDYDPYSPYTPYAQPVSDNAFAGSLLKLEALRFVHPRANASIYFGGGLSYGGTDFGSSWHGSGLQGEMTVGYEFPRASTLRLFVQADAVLPFYSAKSTTYSRTGVTTSHRYAPSLVISIGVGRAHR